MPDTTKSSGSVSQRRSEIDAEIARIRQRCDIKYQFKTGSVEIKGHRRAIDDSDNDEKIDDELARHKAIDSDDERNTR